MKLFGIVAALFVSLVGSARAQTAIQPGTWEVSDKTTMEGAQQIPPTSKSVCLKAADATLENLLFPPPEQIKAQGCIYTDGGKQAGIFKATIACPAGDQQPGVTATAEISFSATSYEGLGQSRSRPGPARRSKARASSTANGRGTVRRVSPNVLLCDQPNAGITCSPKRRIEAKLRSWLMAPKPVWQSRCCTPTSRSSATCSRTRAGVP